MRNYFTKKGYKFLMLLCTGMVFLNLSAAVAAESITSSDSQVEGQDEENLAELNKQLNNAITNTELRQRAIEKGFQHALRFDAEKLTREMMGCYNEVMSTPNTKA